ncbi:MAG: recombinase family protein, partial [Salinibacter sp.]|uniref:recombinase family protein n=1 Tax=Salinibacter sp. TaxID=2065818 RepID=UPI002FC2FAE6
MEAARWRAIDCVVVRKFDRFARGASHLIRVLDELGHLGICFVSEQGQHRPRQPDGKAMSAIIGAMAELESSFTSERAEASMQTTEEEGKHVGCPPTPDET